MKSNHKLIHQIQTEIWSIIPEYLQALYQAALNMDRRDMRDEHEQGYFFRGNTAVIRVHGALGKNLDMWDKYWFGMTDYDDIRSGIESANADPKAENILLHMDTPGGTVNGLPEVANVLNDSPKRTVAYTETKCASAGYWLAGQCDSVLLSESAEVGSVGVYVALLDQSRWLEQMGLKVNAISSGKHKLDYAPWEPLKDDARARMQESVNKWHDEFKSAVTRNRRIPEANMEGQMFEGIESVTAGLADGVANSMSDVLGLLT